MISIRILHLAPPPGQDELLPKSSRCLRVESGQSRKEVNLRPKEDVRDSRVGLDD